MLRAPRTPARGRGILPAVVTLLLLAGLVASPAAAQTPLGASLVPGGVEFAVFSEHASRIEVWIFPTPTAAVPTSRHPLTETDPVDHVWTVTVPGLGAGTLYGYRAWGPNWTWDPAWTPGSTAGFGSHVDAAGNRFNPNKLLTDPYAKAVTGEPLRAVDPATGEAHYSTAILGGTDAFAFVDSAGAMPKSIVVDDASFDWSGDVAPATSLERSVVYEVHLRGFTRADTSLPPAMRGTYDGFAADAPYLAGLGVTAAELLPVHEFPRFDDPVGSATADRVNYWGYMTTQFFAPNREYLCTDPASCPFVAGEQVDAFKGMVKALHAAGIEVWLDVVFNHTFEGGGCAGVPVRYLNLRGLDNQSYYTLADDRSCYWETTGTGNNLNASRAPVRRLILDSLAYWIDEMHVDGFRFDLAYELGREGNDGRDFNPDAQTLLSIAALGQEKGVKMVAEAWDTACSGVGQFPAGWSEWNGFWRDNLRRYVKGDDAQVGSLGTSITATWPGFASPPESLDFVTAHDGFTLNDLVSYNTKQNGTGPCDPTGADPTSGSDSNDSWDHGGDEVLRRREIRNFAVHLLLDAGVPQILAGDEMRRTQAGNNNAYMADNPCGWIDWQDLADHHSTYEVFRRLIALRRSHPALERSAAVGGIDHDGDGYRDLGWHGTSPDQPDWSTTSHTLAYLLDGSRQETGAAFDAPDLYVASNAFWGNLTFTLPTAPGGKCWWLAADTADWAEGTGNVYVGLTLPGPVGLAAWDALPLPRVSGSTYGVQARSTLVLLARPCSAEEAVRVDFTVDGFITQPGQDLYVVGSAPELGGWDPTRAVKLNWVDSDTWSGPAFFAASRGTTVEYKYIVRQGGAVTWEAGANRTYPVPASGAGGVMDFWHF